METFTIVRKLFYFEFEVPETPNHSGNFIDSQGEALVINLVTCGHSIFISLGAQACFHLLLLQLGPGGGCQPNETNLLLLAPLSLPRRQGVLPVLDEAAVWLGLGQAVHVVGGASGQGAQAIIRPIFVSDNQGAVVSVERLQLVDPVVFAALVGLGVGQAEDVERAGRPGAQAWVLVSVRGQPLWWNSFDNMSLF